MNGLQKYQSFFTVAFWDNPHYPFWDLRSRDLKIFLGYDINYLSIWPFMHHPWFPTRKASKLISKWIMWIISKSHREFFSFFFIFAIHWSSRHEKCCQMSVRLFSLFQGSRNQQWNDMKINSQENSNMFTQLKQSFNERTGRQKG